MDDEEKHGKHTHILLLLLFNRLNETADQLHHNITTSHPEHSTITITTTIFVIIWISFICLFVFHPYFAVKFRFCNILRGNHLKLCCCSSFLSFAMHWFFSHFCLCLIFKSFVRFETFYSLSYRWDNSWMLKNAFIFLLSFESTHVNFGYISACYKHTN